MRKRFFVGENFFLDFLATDALEPAFYFILHNVRCSDEVINGQRKRRRIREIGIDEIFDGQFALNGHRPLGNLLADIAGSDALGAQ